VTKMASSPPFGSPLWTGRHTISIATRERREAAGLLAAVSENRFKETRVNRAPVISALVLLLGALPASQAAVAQGAESAPASSAAAGDFSGLVDIGGRKLYWSAVARAARR
jgi:hypothetical protein